MKQYHVAKIDKLYPMITNHQSQLRQFKYEQSNMTLIIRKKI
jgi:hypothetical protein